MDDVPDFSDRGEPVDNTATTAVASPDFSDRGAPSVEPDFSDRGEELKPARTYPSTWEALNTPVTHYFGTSLGGIAEGAQKLVREYTLPKEANEAIDAAQATIPGKVVKGYARAQWDLADSFLSPVGIATLGMGGLPRVIQKAISLAFAADMITHMPQQAQQIKQAWDAKDPEELTRGLMGFAGTGVFAYGALKHGLTEPKPSAEQIAAAKQQTEDFWKGVQAKGYEAPTGPEDVTEAVRNIYPRDRRTINRLRVRRFDQPQPGDQNAINEGQQPISDEGKLPRTPPRQDVQPNTPPIRQGAGTETNGGDSTQPSGPVPQPPPQPPPQAPIVQHYMGGALSENIRLPIFTTTSKSGAEWYAGERGAGGKVHEVDVESKNPFPLFNESDVKKLTEVLDEAGVKYTYTPSSPESGWFLEVPEVANHSPYNGDNPLDVAYIPAVREALVRRGYDSIKASDVLENGEIPVTVLIREPGQLKFTNAPKPTAPAPKPPIRVQLPVAPPPAALPFAQRIKAAVDEGRLVNVEGSPWAPAMANRPMVFVKIGNGVLPFYRSSKGTGGHKKAGEWQPFFGFGDNAWLIKGTGEEIHNSYGSPEIKAAQQWLNQNFNWPHELDLDLQYNAHLTPLSTFKPANGGLAMKQIFGEVQFDNVFNRGTSSGKHINSVLEKLGVKRREQAAPTAEPPAPDAAGRLIQLKAIKNPTPEQVAERDALQAKSDAVKQQMASQLQQLKQQAPPPPPAEPVPAPPEPIATPPVSPAAAPTPKFTDILNDADKARLADLQAQLREKLRPRLGITPEPVDPSIIITAGEMAGLYAKAGIKHFAAFAKQLKDDLPDIWDNIKPHLKSIWEAAAIHDNTLDEPSRAQVAQTVANLDQQVPPPYVAPGPNDVQRTEGAVGGVGTGGAKPPAAAGPGPVGPTGAPPAGANQPVQPGVRPPAEVKPEGGPAGRGGVPATNVGNLPQKPGPAPVDTGTGQAGKAAGGQVPGHPTPADPAPDRDLTTPAAAKNIRLTENPAPTGPVARIRANISAIQLLKNLEKTGRFPTDAERATLAAWSGWGSFKELFNQGRAERRDWDAGWMKRYGTAYDELTKLLTPEEFNAAAESSVNAHYTSKEVVGAMWDMVTRLGYKGGKALEPATGSGLFVGYAPDHIAKTTRWTGVELDPITGKIFSYLYPEADVRIQGFEKAKLPNGFYDLAISNVPFHEVGPGAEYPDLNLHNYFIARMLDKVAPGGLVVAITTNHTMDSRAEQRKFLASKGDLVGAIRLPNNAFKESAGTEVVTDILILRKPLDGPFDQAQNWLVTSAVETPQGPTQINQYFADHPEMVLGKNALTGTMYRKDSYTVEGSGDLEQKLAAAIGKLPADIFAPPKPELTSTPTTQLEEFSLVESGNQVLESRNFQLRVPEWDSGNLTLLNRARAFIALRDTLKRQYSLEGSPDATDAEIEANRSKLNQAYKNLVKKTGGPLNENRRKLDYLSNDPDFYTVMGTEIKREVADPANPGNTLSVIEPADILKRRVIQPDVPPTKVDSASDALGVSLAYRGRVDMDYLKELTGLNEEQIESQLISEGLAFKDPETGKVVNTQDYLTGDVRDKLQKAIFAAKESDTFARNVDALKGVIPTDVPFDKIRFDITGRWIPPEVMSKFAEKVMGLPPDIVSYVPGIEQFAVKAPRRGWGVTPSAWSTSDMGAPELLEYALNFKRARIMVKVDKDKYVENVEASALNNQFIGRIKEEFVKWARTTNEKMPYRIFDSERGEYRTEDMPVWELMQKEFNRTKNSFVIPDTDGSKLKLPGLSPSVRRTPHLVNGVMRAITSGNAVFGHGTGSGKTFLLTAISHEMKRIGLMKKDVIVVKKSTVAQYRDSIQKAYPGSRILIPSKEDFQMSNRRTMAARIASGKWDFIVLTHEQFKAIRTSPKSVEDFFNDQIDQLREILRDLGSAGAEEEKSTRGMDPSVRSLVKKIKSLKKRLDAHTTAIGKAQDAGLNWEAMGIDGVLIDESHNFKKMPIPTQMDNVKGIPTDFSQRAVDLLIKIRGIQKKTGGRNVFFASGTPVSNTLAELWVMFHATSPKLLDQFKISTFDSFASAYADVVSNFELGWDNRFKDVTRMSRFKNGASLTMLTRMGMDVRMGNKELGLDVPDIQGGKPTVVISKITPPFERWLQLQEDVSAAWDVLDPKGRWENSWVPIATMRAGVSAALDPRCVFADAEDHPNSKVNQAVREILKEFEAGKERRTTMMVFADMYRTMNTEKLMGFLGRDPVRKTIEIEAPPEESVGDETGDTSQSDAASFEKTAVGSFNLYDDIRNKLIKAGVPENEVAVITDHDTDIKREILFNKVRSGAVRILIGSTEKIGEGVDVPQRMSAQFHLDPPMAMNPAKMEQRIGRIIRQGNLHSPANWNIPVKIMMFAQERSMDAAIYQMLETKAAMVLQAMKGQYLGDSFEDPAGELSISMAEMKSAATGDARVLDMAKMTKVVRDLTLEEGAYYRRVSELRNASEMAKREAEYKKREAANLRVVAESASNAMADPEKVVVTAAGKKITGKAAIDTWLEAAHSQMDAALKDRGQEIAMNFTLGNDLKVRVIGKVPMYGDPIPAYTATFYVGPDIDWVVPRWDSDINSVESIYNVATSIPRYATTKAAKFDDLSAVESKKAADLTDQVAKTTFDKEPELRAARAKLNDLESELRGEAVAKRAAAQAAKNPPPTPPSGDRQAQLPTPEGDKYRIRAKETHFGTRWDIETPFTNKKGQISYLPSLGDTDFKSEAAAIEAARQKYGKEAQLPGEVEHPHKDFVLTASNGEKYSYPEIQDEVRNHIENLRGDNELEGLDFSVKDIIVTGSRAHRGTEPRANSDLDVVLLYEKTGEGKGPREDDMFNAFARTPLHIGGIQVDINPIRFSRYQSEPHVKQLISGEAEGKPTESVGLTNKGPETVAKPTSSETQAQLGTGERPIRETTAVGLDQIREAFSDPRLGYSPETVQRALDLLDQPVMKNLDWSKLVLSIRNKLEGNARGAAWVHDMLLEMGSNADAKTFPHEIFHFLYEVLPEDYRAAIDAARIAELRKIYGENIPPELEAGTMDSYAFQRAGMPLSQYHLSTPSEYLAEVGSDRFVRKAFAERNAGFWEKLKSNLAGWVRAIVDWAQRRYKVTPDMARVTRELLRGVWKPTPESAAAFERKWPQRQASLGKALETFEQKELEEPGSGRENVRLEQAAQPIAQLPHVKAAISRLRALANQQLPRDATPEMRQQQATAQRVLSNPWIRSQFVKPVGDVERAAGVLQQSADTYATLKDDPSISDEMKSGAAGLASKDIDSFYSAKQKFDNRFENDMASLRKKLDDVLAEKVESNVKKVLGDILLDDFKTMGRELVNQSGDAGMLVGYRRMLGQQQAVKNVLEWAGKNMDLKDTGPDWKATPDEVIKFMDEIALNKFGSTNLEQTVGASTEVIRDVAKFLSGSERLRDAIAQSNEAMRNTAALGVFDNVKQQMAQAVREGKYEKAINLLVKGVGKTAAETTQAREIAKLMGRREARLLTAIDALQQSKDLMDTVEASSDFRRLATEIYGDAGVREVIRGLQGNQYVLKPIYDEPPTVLDYSSDQVAAESNLSKLRRYRDAAMDYVTNVDAEGYDPRKAAGLNEFLKQSSWFMNPSIMPSAGRLMPSFAMTLPRKLFGMLGGIEQVPNVVLRYGAGLAAEQAQRTLNALSTAKEVAMATFTTFAPKLDNALFAAAKEHKLTPEQYHELILNPLAASRQYFGNVRRLNVGNFIGNGYRVTAADMAFFTILRRFNREMIEKLTGTAKENFEVLKNNPTGILTTENGKLTMRLPFETGPDTVSRHFGQVRDWAREWPQLNDQQKVDFVNQNLNRLLFGYVADVGQPSFSFRYAFDEPFREILDEAKGGAPIGSFDDLANRVKEKLDAQAEPDAPLVPIEEVRQTMLKEIGLILDRVRRYDEQGIRSSKHKMSAYGGENSFNTERGGQIMPSNWYDYGSVTTGQHLTYLNAALTKFAIEHADAMEALQRALTQTVRDFEKRQEAAPTTNVRRESVKERRAGRDFYSWNEAIVTLRQVTDYLNKLKAAMNYEKRAKAIESGNMLGAQTPLDMVSASLLSSPGPNIMNSFGGALNVVLTDMLMRNEHAYWSVPRNAARGAYRVFKEGVRLMAHEGNPVGRAIYKALKTTADVPVIGKIPGYLGDVADQMRNLYEEGRRDALVLNKQLKDTLGEMWNWRDMGGIVNSKPDRRLSVRLARQAETIARMGSRALSQATVGFVDSRINVTSKRFVEELQQDLENRARKFGLLRERAAQADGYDAYDPSDKRNLFSAKELGGGRIPDPGLDEFALRLRETLRRDADINLDAAMMDFHRRYKAAAEQEQAEGRQPGDLTKDVHLFDDAQMRQLRLAVAAITNLSTMANRPIISRTGRVQQVLGLFLNYPAFQMHKMTELFNRISNKSFVKGHASNLPYTAGAYLAASMIGAVGLATAEELRRWLMHRYSPVPTIFEADTPEKAANALIGGLAALLPFYGTAINSARGQAYKNGFDLNSQFVAVNLATDAMRSIKEMYQTGTIGQPMLKFGQRWLFPLNYIAPLTPQVQGLQEVSNTRNLMVKGARDTDMETLLRKPDNSSFTYTPVTPLLNEAMAAVGRGDTQGFNDAYQKIVQFERDRGVENPERSALQALNARNPITQVFGSKPIDAQLQQVLANLPADQAAAVSAMLSRYGQAVSSVGGNEQVTRIERGGGRLTTTRNRLRMGRSTRSRFQPARMRAPKLGTSRMRFRQARTNRLRRRATIA